MQAAQRILVTGNAGAGKTTLARDLSERFGLPYVGLDAIVWQPGWVRTPPLQRRRLERAIAAESAWVADGVSAVLMQAADMIVFLDQPRWRCYLRVARRNRSYLWRSRPGLPEDCPELLIAPSLIRLIWRFPQHARPQILRYRESMGRFIWLRGQAECQRWLAALKPPVPR